MADAAVADDPFANGANPFLVAPPTSDDDSAPPLTIFASPPKGVAAATDQKGDPFANGNNPFLVKPAPASGQAAPYPGMTLKSAASAAASGLSEGAIDALGAPGDLITGAGNLVTRGINAVAGTNLPVVQSPIGSAAIKNAFGTVLPGSNPDDFVPQNEAERVIKGTGAGIGSSVVPVGMAGALGSKVAAAAEPFVGAATPGGLAANAAIGAGSGAGGQIAQDAAPAPLKPLAATIGGIAGGGASVAAMNTPALVGAGARAVQHFVEPMTAAGPQAIADRTISAGTVNRPAAMAALDAHAANPDLVPGSEPTTFQVTGDMGHGAMEREAETAAAPEFQTRRANQNEARVGVLNKLQPTGDPAAVSGHINDQLAQIDADSARMVNGVAGIAQDKAAAVGGQGAPEDYGTGMRAALASANDAAKTRESALWKAVDPDNTLALPASPVVAAAKNTVSSVGQLAKPMAGEEKAIFETASGLPSVVPFGDLTDLRSRVSAEMRNQIGPNGNAVSYGRLSQLRGSIQDAIENAVQHKAALEQSQVARGTLAPADTMEGRLAAKRDQFLAERAGASDSGAGDGASASGGSNSASRNNGTVGQAGRGSSDNAGAPRVPSQALSPNIDEDAAARLSAASDATKARKQTFGQGAVGQTLASQGTKDNYRILDSAVGQKFWKPGPTGAEAVKALAKTAPDAVDDLAGYAGLSLRKAALNADGTIDPGKFATWQKAHGEALRALKEVDPDTAAKFSDAAKAGDVASDAAALRKTALDNYQKSSLGKFLKVSDPADVTKTVGGIFGQKDSVQQMRKLSQTVASNPDARDGLRKAIADYMTSKFVSNREAGTSGVNAMRGDPFQTFVRDNRPVLGQVFKPEEIKGIEAVAADIARSNRSIDAVKLPGRSNTPQDLIKELQKGQTAHLSPFAEMMASGAAGYELGGIKGAAIGGLAAGGKAVLSSMRAAGISKASDLVNQMLLHPDLARAALERAPETAPQSSVWRRVGQQLNRVATINANRMVTGSAR